MGGVGADSGTIATFDHAAFPAQRLAALKGHRRVSVCIPARDEAGTIAGVVAVLRTGALDRLALVDEVVVVDDGSLDDTADVARQAGARVLESVPGSRARGLPVALGKGGAMRRALEETSGEIVVFLDADVTNLRPHFVTGMLGPLFSFPEVGLVKGCYERPCRQDATGGGRVTELTARPALALLFPELAGVRQPLAGETAARREVLEALEFTPGYGVEIGLLLDVARRHGTSAIAQVDLGVRIHRNRPLAELAPQAREVLAVVLERAGRDPLLRAAFGSRCEDGLAPA